MSASPELPERFTRTTPVADSPLERVFAAHDSVLQRDVWIKLPGEAAAGWSAPVKERLLREARALAKVRHPNVAPVLWVEQTADGPLCVVEPPRGETLTDRLEHGPIEICDVLRLGIDVAEALAATHYQGIVHRAVGPRTIRVLPDGTAQLGGFTFAKELSGHEHGSSLSHGHRHTAPNARHLPEYSAPEQLAGAGSEPRSDIYALGCTLYRCLAGEDAFAPERRHEPMPDLRGKRKDVPKALMQVVRTCAMHSKTARFATAREVADALRAVQAKLASPGANGGGRGRTALLAGGGATVAAAALLLFGGDLFGSNRPLDRSYEAPDQAAVTRRYEQTYSGKYDRVHGLFVGIGEAYGDTPLRALENPVPDVEAVIDRLKANDAAWRRDSAVAKLLDHDATAERMLEELDRIRLEARTDDAVLIYFAGHAQQNGDTFGLCGANASGDVQLGGGYLRREVLQTFFDDVRAKHVLAILDCCHSGAVFEDRSRGRDGPSKKKVDLAPGAHHMQHFSREFLASCGAKEHASDGLGRSPFCRLLLEELGKPATGERSYVAARYLGAHIAEAMDGGKAKTGMIQVPHFRQVSRQDGSFVFRLAKE